MTRKEMNERLQGLTIMEVRTTKAYGNPDDEAGTIEFDLDDDSTLLFFPTGYEADGVGFSLEERDGSR